MSEGEYVHVRKLQSDLAAANAKIAELEARLADVTAVAEAHVKDNVAMGEQLERRGYTVGDAIGLRSIEDMYASALGSLDAANARADAAEREQANLLADYKNRADECDRLEAERNQLAARVTELEEDKAMYDRSRVELYRQACTPEERKVLEACRDAKIVCPPDCYPYFENEHPVAIAELANRAAKAKRGGA